MSIYKHLDNISMSLGGAFIKQRYFSESVESPSIKEWFDVVTLDVPAINGEGYYPVNAHYEGVTNEAAFRIEQWKGDQYPTIIYHHGAAEGSYDFSFNRILKKDKNDIEANLIAIQALFNHDLKDFMNSIPSLSNYSVMLATSVLIVEELTDQIRKRSDNKIIVTGTSLGGFITNLHFTYYNTADYYKPMLSGARMGDVFIDSAYSKVTSENGKRNPDKLRSALNFQDDLRNQETKNLHLLLAKHDQLVKFDLQSQDFESEQISTIPYGHASGATKFKLLRQHILKDLPHLDGGASQ